MGKRLEYALCFLILPLFLVVHASEGQSDEHMELSLQECISLALESNLDIRVQRIAPQIQNTYLTMAKGRFDPSATFGPTLSRSEDPSSSTLSGADVRINKSWGLSLGLKDPIITGGSYGLSFSSSRAESNSSFETLNPSYRSGLSFTVTQPLLDGFGIGVNKASIIIAGNNQDISFLRLKSQLIRTLSEVQKSYWELVFALENLKVQQLALQQAQDLLAINKRFKEVGKASTSDILQAQSAVASREADVIAGGDAVKDAEDRLKQIINIVKDESQWDFPIIPIDAPSLENIEADMDESIVTALAGRPEYAQAKLDMQNSDISIKVAKNGRLPVLDLEGSFSLNGLGGEMNDSFSQVGGADYKSWYFGLAFRMPLGERVARAELRQNLLAKEQKLLEVKSLEQQIINEVRGAVRQLQTDEKRIEATRAAEEFAIQVLATEERKHKLQLSTSYELLQFQANLATATKNRLRAAIDYRKSIVSLYQALGVTLDKLNIEF